MAVCAHGSPVPRRPHPLRMTRTLRFCPNWKNHHRTLLRQRHPDYRGPFRAVHCDDCERACFLQERLKATATPDRDVVSRTPLQRLRKRRRRKQIRLDGRMAIRQSREVP
jgi:hypothetical protein